jgi:hypothetical protein
VLVKSNSVVVVVEFFFKKNNSSLVTRFHFFSKARCWIKIINVYWHDHNYMHIRLVKHNFAFGSNPKLRNVLYLKWF